MPHLRPALCGFGHLGALSTSTHTGHDAWSAGEMLCSSMPTHIARAVPLDEDVVQLECVPSLAGAQEAVRLCEELRGWEICQVVVRLLRRCRGRGCRQGDEGGLDEQEDGDAPCKGDARSCCHGCASLTVLRLMGRERVRGDLGRSGTRAPPSQLRHIMATCAMEHSSAMQDAVKLSHAALPSAQPLQAVPRTVPPDCK